MGFYLARQAVLKWLETPSVYQIARDELYELDQESFRFLGACAGESGCSSPDSALIDYCLDEGILTREPVHIRRPQLMQSPHPSLRYLELQITNACNLRCRHCYLGDGAGSELRVEEVHSVLSEFQALQGLRVLITGGEPLLHTRFIEINDMLPDFFLRKVLFTNGTLLDRDLLKRLRVNEIQISIDGSRDAHDHVRGAGTWAVAVEALRSALDAGFSASVSTMVHRRNLDDFDDMEKLFRSLGVSEWTVDVPCATGRMRSNRDLLVSPGEGGRLLAYGYGGGMHASGPGYACGLHLMSVLPDGHAAKCTFYGDRPVGTIREGLRACWERIQPVRLDLLDCDCGMRDTCRGGCRYRAELSGHPRGRDPYRCSLYGIVDSPEER